MKSAENNKKWNLVIVMVCLLALPGLVSAQSYLLPPDTLDIFEPATQNGFLPSARTAAMGGAGIAAGTDGSALWYNPALLTRIRNFELSASLSNQRLKDETSIYGVPTPEAKVNNTRFGGLWAIFPVPTESGGLTLGAAVNRVKSFDRIFRFASSAAWFNNPLFTTGWGGGEDESGNLWAWSFGGAVEVSPKMSVGLSLDIFDGSDDYTNFFDSTDVASNYALHYSKTINSSYTGISGKAGFSYIATNWLTVAGIVGFPQSNSIDQTVDVIITDNSRSFPDNFITSYRYTLPFWFGLGAMANYRDFTITGDATYKDFSQLSYRRGQPDLAQANQEVMKYYNGVFNYHIGAEYFIRSAGISLRAGYDLEPIAFKGFPVSHDPHYYTFGVGFLIENAINFDLAYLTGSWEQTDFTKTNPSLPILAKYSPNRFLATVAYRF